MTFSTCRTGHIVLTITSLDISCGEVLEMVIVVTIVIVAVIIVNIEQNPFMGS